MKTKILTAAVIAAMLTLTACGDADTKTTSESKADTTTTAATEEVTTEPVTEEVTTETTPAVETTVTTTTEATTTTEEIPPEPEREAFQLAPGLSEKYVDFDNLAVEFNGQIFRFGEATVQDLLDAGVELFSDELDDEVGSSHREIEAQVKITDRYRATLKFRAKGSDCHSARECVLTRFSVTIPHELDYDILSPNYGEGMVHTNIPIVMTMDELLENSGEPTKLYDGDEPGFKICVYKAPSILYPDSVNSCTKVDFDFLNNGLYSFYIDICANK